MHLRVTSNGINRTSVLIYLRIRHLEIQKKGEMVMTEEIINGVSNDSSGAEVISQIQNDENIFHLRDTAGTYYIAQTFRPGSNYTITAIELMLLRTGNPRGYVWVELWTTSGGNPSALISGAISTKIKASDISGSATQYKFYLPKGISVSSGTTYAVVINCDVPVDASNYILMRDNSTGGLTNGQVYWGTSGLSWNTNADADLWIKLYEGTLVPLVLNYLDRIPVNANSPIKGWINFDGTGTISFPGSARGFYNVAGLTDNGTGEYTISWDVDFASANYAVACFGQNNTYYCVVAGTSTALAVGSCRVAALNTAENLIDTNAFTVIAIGD